MIENVLVKLGILNDHDNDQYNRVELFLEDAERAIKIESAVETSGDTILSVIATTCVPRSLAKFIASTAIVL
mgnify:CR=1 FL=1